jgi:hypothetical protein
MFFKKSIDIFIGYLGFFLPYKINLIMSDSSYSINLMLNLYKQLDQEA